MRALGNVKIVEYLCTHIFNHEKKHNNPQMSFLITKKAEYVGQ